MNGPARILTVETVEPCCGAFRRRHAVLTARGGEGVDVVHLWTDDLTLAAALAPGAQVEVRVLPDLRHWVVFRTDADGVCEWLSTRLATNHPIEWTAEQGRAARFYTHDLALRAARICAAAGHTVAVMPRD